MPDIYTARESDVNDVNSMQDGGSMKASPNMPVLDPEIHKWILQLFHTSTRRTDTKRLSANKLYGETIINMIKSFEPVIVRNGNEWRRYTFIDAVILTPTVIQGDGQCERTVPLKCLRQNQGYHGDVMAFIREEIFIMKCDTDEIQFDTRQMQQEKRRVAIEAINNEGVASLNMYGSSAMGEGTGVEAGDAENREEEMEEGWTDAKVFQWYQLIRRMLQSSHFFCRSDDSLTAWLDLLVTTYSFGLAHLGAMIYHAPPLPDGLEDALFVSRELAAQLLGYQGDTQALLNTYPGSIESQFEHAKQLIHDHSFFLHDICHYFDWSRVKVESLQSTVKREEQMEQEKSSNMFNSAAMNDADVSSSSTGWVPPSTPSYLWTPSELIQKFGTKQGEYTYPYVKLFDLHILLQSMLDNMNEGLGAEYGECSLDDGGCFITNSGVEKILMFRQALVPNLIMSQYKKPSTQKTGQFFVECRSEHVNENRSTSTFYLSFVPDKLINSTQQDLEDMTYKSGRVVGKVSLHLQNIPFVVWMRALGVDRDTDIRDMYRQAAGLYDPNEEISIETNGTRMSMTSFHERVLRECLADHQGCFDHKHAILRIGYAVGGKTIAEQWFHGNKKIRNEVLPHIGKSADPDEFKIQCYAKARFLCRMLHDLLMTVEAGIKDGKKADNIFIINRDSYQYRTFQSIDELLAPLIQQYMKPHFTKFIPQTILKRLDRSTRVNIHEVFYMHKISKSLNFNISMGVWHATPGLKNQTGVSQNIARHNYCDTLSQHDKVMNPVHKEGKQITPRLLQESAIGISDCVDTPEGDSSGLHRQNAQFLHQAIGSAPDCLLQLLETYDGDTDTIMPTPGHYALVKPFQVHHSQHNSLQGSRKSSQQGFQAHRPSTIFLWTVYVNQVPIGLTCRPDALLRYIRLLRRRGVISVDTSCSYGAHSDPWDVCINDRTFEAAQTVSPTGRMYTHGVDDLGRPLNFDPMHPYENRDWLMQAGYLRKYVVEIRTHSARNMRQLFVVENLYKLAQGFKHMRLTDLLSEGIIEYVDVEEAQDLLIAADWTYLQKSVQAWNTEIWAKYHTYPASKRTCTYSHAECHPSFIYGACAAIIVFAQCNPPARNAFETHMSKHAQGKATTTSKTHRMDTNFNELWFPERPEVTTQTYESLQIYRLSFTCGNEILVKCARNEEDSQDVNASIIQLGYYASSQYHTSTYQERKEKNKIEKIGLFGPDDCSGFKIGCDYSKLDERGIICNFSTLQRNTVLIQKQLNGQDTSIVYQSDKPAVVDGVFPFWNEQNLLVVKIRLRETRMSEEGDKLASGHAQKGVIDRLRRRENMSYNADTGQTPDVIYNSTAFISRSTFAMYNEMEAGDLAAINGNFIDATPLTNEWVKGLPHVMKLMKEGTITDDDIDLWRPSKTMALERFHMGLHPFASYSHIDMRTGERIPELMFSGRCSMQKLRQMVQDKIKARGLGPISSGTKQPSEGKKVNAGQDGGQKIGNMEAPCIKAYGSSNVLFDRMLLCSDPHYQHICRTCHKNAIYVQHLDMNFCLNCEKTNSANNVFGSATFNLFANELAAMGLSLEQHTK